MNKKMNILVFIILTILLLIPSLVAATGNITVSSVPSGATVLVNGVSTGTTTPTIIEALNSGIYLISLRLTGYQDYTQSVTVSNNTTSVVSGTLIVLVTTTEQITNGSIQVASNPSNAAVFVNTEYQGKTPLILYNISYGMYRILVQKTGYQDWSERISVTSGVQSNVYASLQATVTDTATATAIPTVITLRTTISRTSTAKVPTPWPSETPAPSSPVSVLTVVGAVGLGFVVIRK